jgi:mono/diheme cytochrome c family protein
VPVDLATYPAGITTILKLLKHKKEKMKRQMLLFAILFLMPTLFSFTVGPKDPWKVPEKYEKLKNLVLADESPINSGKEIFKLYCTSCHGERGKGTGKRAANLDTPPSDFTSADFQKQSDGSLLYKVYFGHKDMPGIKNDCLWMVLMKIVLAKPATFVI